MRAKRNTFALMAICSFLWAYPQEAADLAAELTQYPSYISDATFEVLLPQAAEPVVYDITLQSKSAEADSLSPCDYLIRWEAKTSTEPIKGFSAYFDGNHYRYRNSRLQEYHAEASVEPFMPLGPGSQLTNGVHTTAQFADMLPQILGARLSKMITDSSYIFQYHPDTIIAGKHRTVVDGVKRGNGFDIMRYSYIFDQQTHLPVLTEIENSPGSISEQIVTITFKPTDTQPIEISENGLMEEWPEVFDLYRESTFRSENLVNTMLPSFASQRLDGQERYSHNQNEPMPAPTIIVILDPEVATTPQIIDDIRQAVDMAPIDIEVIWAFNSNRSDEISALLGKTRSGEHALISANSLIRNCGITLFPTTILVDKTSKIKDVVPGYNKDTGLIVLQKAVLL